MKSHENMLHTLLENASASMQREAWLSQDVQVQHKGTKITLPSSPTDMPIDEAITTLERLKTDQEQEMDVHEVINAFPEDALVALNTAMKEKFGWASAIPTPGMFGSRPPQLITVDTGPKPDEKVQVPAGRFTLPNVESPIDVRPTRTAEGFALLITGTVRKREADVVKELAILTRKILAERSIYKGKAIRIRTDDDGNMQEDMPPMFLETDNIKPDELILNPVELSQVEASIWNPIKHTEKCIEQKIPLNRGILIEGTYGTGKTMTANVTSKVCVDNGWTYILLDDVRGLKEALLFAQRYQPALIFAEDAERVASSRDQRGNDLLNTIDGVLTKNAQVFTVLTTNHVEKITKAMLRPGRFDAVISVLPPEAEAVQRLVRLYGRDTIDASEDLTLVGEVLAGNIPATVREVVERSKLLMLGKDSDQVTAQDLVFTAEGMKRHLDLLKEEAPKISDEEALGQAFATIISKSAGGGSRQDFIDIGRQMIKVVTNRTDDLGEETSKLKKAVTESGENIGEQLHEIDSTVGKIYNEVM